MIRSIQDGLQLRSYLEGLTGLSLHKLRKILRFHFQEKSATELYQLLANISQMPKEDPQSFLIRALTIRQKIVFASQESDSKIKYDEELVQELFPHAVETGIADETIRAKVRPLLKNTSVADEDLTETMSLAMHAESERANKFTQGKSVKQSITKESKLEAEANGEPKGNSQGNQRENQILATLKTIQSELNSVQTEVASLQKKVDDKVYPRNCSPTNDAEVNGVTRKDTMYRPTNPYPRQCKVCIENKPFGFFPLLQVWWTQSYGLLLSLGKRSTAIAAGQGVAHSGKNTFRYCNCCQKEEKDVNFKRCSTCKLVYYCSTGCQKRH